jgi:hypothetical protein
MSLEIDLGARVALVTGGSRGIGGAAKAPRTTNVWEASRLLSAILFVDLGSEGYHAFFNPRATNPIPNGIESFTMNSHPVTALLCHDDYR